MPSASLWPLLLGTGVLFGLGLPLSQLGARAGIDVLAFALWPTLAAALGLAALGWWRHGPLKMSAGLLRFGLLAGTFGHAVPASAGFWLARETGAGFAALVLIPLSIAGANLYRARHLPRAVPTEWLAALMLFSSASVLAVSSALHGDLALPLRGEALVWPLVQAGAMMAGYLLFFTLQRRAEPVTLSVVGYISMSTGMAVAAVGFGERLPAIVWPALALILGSMWLLQRSTGAARPPAAKPESVAPRAKCRGADSESGGWPGCVGLACA